MNIERDVFKRSAIDFVVLERYGFVFQKGIYVFETLILNNRFKVVVSIDNNSFISGEVYDLDFNDIFLNLHADAVNNKLTNAVRDEYKKVLTDIKDCCTR